MKKFAPVVLRVGISLVMIWFGMQQINDPSSWIPYLPVWTKSLALSQLNFIYLNGWFEVSFGLLLMLGFYTRVAALLLALHLLGIVFDLGYNQIAVRDFGLSVALISVFLQGTSALSLDEFFERGNTY